MNPRTTRWADVVKDGSAPVLSLWLGSYVLPVGLFALLTGMFWIGDRSLYHKLFYASVALPGFVAVLVRPALLKEVWCSPIGRPFLAFSAFMLTSLLWSGTDTNAWSLIKRPLYILLLFVAVVAVAQTREERLRQVLVSATLIATLAAAVSLATFPWVGQARLPGHGALYNPLLTSHVFGFFTALTMAAWITQRGRWQFPAAAACALLGTVLLATGSRTPLLGVSVTAIWLAALSGGRRGLAIVAALVAAGAFVIASAPDLLLSRGLSYRPEIWGEAMRQIRDVAIFGYGYDHPLRIPIAGIPYNFTDPHNIFLAVLLHGGAVGFSLWLWIYGAALVSCWLNRHRSIVFICSAALVYGMAASMTEGGAFLSRPKEHWFLIWIPLAFLSAITLKSRKHDRVIQQT